MNTPTFQLQISYSNYDGPSGTSTKKIDSLQQFYQYIDVIKAINASERKGWNWFSSIPQRWDGHSYVDDKYAVESTFEKSFNKKIPADQIIAFFRKFTPHGADRISDIAVYKVEKIEL